MNHFKIFSLFATAVFVLGSEFSAHAEEDDSNPASVSPVDAFLPQRAESTQVQEATEDPAQIEGLKDSEDSTGIPENPAIETVSTNEDAAENKIHSDQPKMDWTFTIDPDRPNLFLNLNGYAWHFEKGDESEEKVNDWPLGVGLTYELKRKKDYIWTVDGDLFFVDSNNDFAAAVASSILWRTGFIDIGARGGILYKQNFVDDWGVPLAPVILPFLQWESRYFAIKVIYIPPVRKSTDEQLFFQILVPLGQRR